MQGVIPYYGANSVQGYIDRFIFDEDLILLAEDGGHFDDFSSFPIAQLIHGKTWVNNHAHVLRPKAGNIDFLFQQLVHKDIRKYINGTSRAKLNQEDLLQIPISTTSIPEQEKIGTFLGCIDKRIATQNKIIEGLRSLEIALRSMAEERFDGQTVPLSSLFDVVKEKARNGVKATVYTASAKYGLVDEELFFKKKISSGNTENYTVIRKGDYVFSKSSSKDAPFGAFLCFAGDFGLVSPLYYVLRPKDIFSPIAMGLWFASAYCQKQMDSVCQEGARNHGMLNISLKDFLNLKAWKTLPHGLEETLDKICRKKDIEGKLSKLLLDQKRYLLNGMFI